MTTARPWRRASDGRLLVPMPRATRLLALAIGLPLFALGALGLWAALASFVRPLLAGDWETALVMAVVALVGGVFGALVGALGYHLAFASRRLEVDSGRGELLEVLDWRVWRRATRHPLAGAAVAVRDEQTGGTGSQRRIWVTQVELVTADGRRFFVHLDRDEAAAAEVGRALAGELSLPLRDEREGGENAEAAR